MSEEEDKGSYCTACEVVARRDDLRAVVWRLDSVAIELSPLESDIDYARLVVHWARDVISEALDLPTLQADGHIPEADGRPVADKPSKGTTPRD